MWNLYFVFSVSNSLILLIWGDCDDDSTNGSNWRRSKSIFNKLKATLLISNSETKQCFIFQSVDTRFVPNFDFIVTLMVMMFCLIFCQWTCKNKKPVLLSTPIFYSSKVICYWYFEMIYLTSKGLMGLRERLSFKNISSISKDVSPCFWNVEM